MLFECVRSKFWAHSMPALSRVWHHMFMSLAAGLKRAMHASHACKGPTCSAHPSPSAARPGERGRYNDRGGYGGGGGRYDRGGGGKQPFAKTFVLMSSAGIYIRYFAFV